MGINGIFNSFFSLSKRERGQISSASLPEGQFEFLCEAYQKAIDMRRRRFGWTALFALGVIVPMVVVTAYSVPDSYPRGAIVFSTAVVVAIFAVAFAIAWVGTIGLLRYQFNKAADKGYPHLPHRRLR